MKINGVPVKGMVQEIKDMASMPVYYESGWDVIHECWTDADIEKLVIEILNSGASTPLAVIQEFAGIASVFYDREQDAINSAF